MIFHIEKSYRFTCFSDGISSVFSLKGSISIGRDVDYWNLLHYIIEF